MSSPYVRSNFPRIADDNYQTIDERCVKALIESVVMGGWFADCCAKNGSGIVDSLKKMGIFAEGMDDAFGKTYANWIVSNPPFDKKIVDNIIWAQIERLHGQAHGVAMLLRSNFDFAKSRWSMFSDNPNYYGQIKMLFRPWWVADKKSSPIHNFVWHIWKAGKYPDKVVKYWRES